MIKIAICDDEKLVLNKLKKISSSFLTENNYSFSIDCFISPVELLNNVELYSIIFLDININEYNGLEIASEIRRINKNAKIIFVTNHSEFVKQALLVRAFGYIEKPIKSQEIKNNLREAIEYLNSNHNSIVKEFKTTSGTMYIGLNNILYFKYFNRVIEIVTIDRTLTMYDTIKNLCLMLEELNFYSQHNAYLINLRHVVAVYNNDVELRNGIKLPISKRKSKHFKTTVANYIVKNEICRLKL